MCRQRAARAYIRVSQASSRGGRIRARKIIIILTARAARGPLRRYFSPGTEIPLLSYPLISTRLEALNCPSNCCYLLLKSVREKQKVCFEEFKRNIE